MGAFDSDDYPEIGGALGERVVREVGTVELILRADADARTGAGHAMRLLALAEEWLRSKLGPVRFWGRLDVGFAATRAHDLAVAVGNGPTCFLERCVLVADLYNAGERQRLAARPEPSLRVLVDDVGGEVPAGFDVVWNPNAYGVACLYPAFAGQVIAGPDA